MGQPSAYELAIMRLGGPTPLCEIILMGVINKINIRPGKTVHEYMKDALCYSTPDQYMSATGDINIHITFRAFSRRFYAKRLTICTFVRRRCNNIAVGTVRMFIEPYKI